MKLSGLKLVFTLLFLLAMVNNDQSVAGSVPGKPGGEQKEGSISVSIHDAPEPNCHFDDDRPSTVYDIPIKVNGREVTAMFEPRHEGSYCGRDLLDALGIPITVQPTTFMNYWFPGLCSAYMGPRPFVPRPVHWVHKVWPVILDIEVLGIRRQEICVSVEDNGGDTMFNGAFPRFGLPADGFILGNSFFAPGSFTIANNRLEFKPSDQEKRLDAWDEIGDWHFPNRPRPSLDQRFVTQAEIEKIDAEANDREQKLELEFQRRLKEVDLEYPPVVR